MALLRARDVPRPVPRHGSSVTLVFASFFQGEAELAFPTPQKKRGHKTVKLCEVKGRFAPRPAAWVQRYAGLCFFLSRKKSKKEKDRPAGRCTCQEKVDSKKNIYQKPRSVLN